MKGKKERGRERRGEKRKAERSKRGRGKNASVAARATLVFQSFSPSFPPGTMNFRFSHFSHSPPSQLRLRRRRRRLRCRQQAGPNQSDGKYSFIRSVFWMVFPFGRKTLYKSSAKYRSNSWHSDHQKLGDNEYHYVRSKLLHLVHILHK